MPRRIVIYAGFHKTGTTTVQRFLRANREALRGDIALRLRWHLKDLLTATRSYSADRDPLSLMKVQSRFGTLLREVPKMPKRTLVIASEDLLGHLPGRPGLADYGAAPELLYAYNEIATAQFPGTEVTLYLSTRAPDTWMASAYWEHVKSFDMTLDFETFVRAYPTASALESVVSDIQSRVPALVHVRSLESTSDLPFGPADPLLDLCEISASLRSRLIAEPLANVQADAAVLDRLLDVNRSTDDANRRKRLKAAILDRAGLA